MFSIYVVRRSIDREFFVVFQKGLPKEEKISLWLMCDEFYRKSIFIFRNPSGDSFLFDENSIGFICGKQQTFKSHFYCER